MRAACEGRIIKLVEQTIEVGGANLARSMDDRISEMTNDMDDQIGGTNERSSFDGERLVGQRTIGGTTIKSAEQANASRFPLSLRGFQRIDRRTHAAVKCAGAVF